MGTLFQEHTGNGAMVKFWEN